MCILTSDGKALTDLGILGGETQHSNIHVCVSASLKGQQANSRWAKENGHSQAGNHSSGASVPTPAPAVAEGDLELAIATSAYCGGSLSLSPGQGYRTPHTSFMAEEETHVWKEQQSSAKKNVYGSGNLFIPLFA